MEDCEREILAQRHMNNNFVKKIQIGGWQGRKYREVKSYVNKLVKKDIQEQMSANNQTLIKEHEGKYYVFSNVQAESWGWDEEKGEEAPNELSKGMANVVCDTRDEAYEKALDIDNEVGSEYGVQFNRLCKDDAEVKIVETLNAD